MISHSQPHKQSVSSLSGPNRIATPPVLSLGDVVRGWTVVARNLESSVMGMQEVLAKDEAGAPVVLRVAPDLDVAARMQRETDLARCHPHPQMVQIVGMVEHQGWPIQVLEHVDGLNLDTISLVNGPIAPAAACRIGWQIALALGELHGRQPIVAHGALSTARVVIDVHGNARLRDLGRILPHQSESRLSPERRQALAKPSAPDDIYALGLIVAEAALGHPLELGEGHLNPRVLEGLLPERIVDAVAALLAPAEARIRNVAAVVRIFVELEHAFGDGADALKLALERARLSLAFGGLSNDLTHDEEDELDNTLPENTIIPPAQLGHAIASDENSLPPAEATEDNAPLLSKARDPQKLKVTQKIPKRREPPSNFAMAMVSLAIAFVFLLGGAGAYGAAAYAGLAPKPNIALRMPDVSLPSVSLPSVSLPSLELPKVALPNVTLPNVELPEMPKLPELRIAADEKPSAEMEKELAAVEAALKAAMVVEAEVVAATDPVKVEPAKVEPAEPAKLEPGTSPGAGARPRFEPAKVEKTVLTSTKPAKPAAKKPVVAKAAPIAKEPIAKAPVAKEPVAKEPVGKEPKAAEPDDTKNVKLVFEVAPATRAAAEAKLKACHISGTIMGGVTTVSPGVVKVSTEPKNRCVERVLAFALKNVNAPEGEPFEVIVTE